MVVRAIAAAATLVVLASGCRQKMADQTSGRPLRANPFFEDGRDSRPLVEGTIARGQWIEDDALASGKQGSEPVAVLPVPVTRALVARGRERYDIFCSPCHDRLGEGNGMVVRRGYPRPESFHTARLRAAKVGYFYDVVTHGFGRMPSYAAQVPLEDRWAIVAYVRALQLSRAATLADLRPADRRALERSAREEANEPPGQGEPGAGHDGVPGASLTSPEDRAGAAAAAAGMIRSDVGEGR